MANFAITVYTVEDYDYAVVAAGMETQLETLDSTTAPVVLAQIFIHPKNGKFVGVLLND